MRTRTTRSTAPAEQPEPEQRSQPLTPAETPSKTFILPSSASDEARFVQLPNPSSGELNRYFFCPKLGLFEFTVVAASPDAPRSILFQHGAEKTEPDSEGHSIPAKGSISKVAQLLIATPIDFMFFMVPLLCPETPNQAKGLFQPLDDIFDSQDELPKHLRYVLYNETFKNTIQQRTEAICDSVEAGDETMLRFSETKLLQELVAKGERMVAQGLPASLEERFVRQALATPLMAVKRVDASTNGAASKSSEGEGESQENKDTPSATNTDSASASEPSGESTPATESPPDEPSVPDGMAELLRISIALSFMKESYLSESLSARLDELLAKPESPKDFKPLQEHLKHVAKLRAEAQASRSLGDFSRKRGPDDEEASEIRAEKKRRKEEEEKKKKAAESRGVKDLKKVNTTGMKKMSDFFTRSAAKKKT